MKSPVESHGTTMSSSVSSRPANIGPNTSGPKIAAATAPKSTNEIPRARLSGGNISAAAARESSTIAPEAPVSAKPTITSVADSTAQPRPIASAARIPATKPARITGMRPKRSAARPAGKTASPPATR